MDPGTADVVRARTQLGNAAVTAAMGGLPRGAEPKPATWAGQMMLAGQNLVGNQAIASQATAPVAPAPTPAGLAPLPQAPVKPPPAPKKPPPAKPTGPKTEAPSASAPDKKDLAKDKTSEDRPDKDAKKEKGTGPRSPGADPKFQALKKDVNTKKKTVGASHPPAAAEAGAAQEAAEAPADDQEARGKAAHAEDMDAAKPKEFNKQEFIQAVKKAIAAKAPKNLDEADKFGESGKAEEVKTEVQGKVGEGKDTSAQEIAETTAAPPEPAPDAKQVVPMAGDKVPGKPGTPNPAQAAPDQLPPSATDMSAGPDQVNQQMAEAKVTEQQLTFKNSREPQFDKAVKEKKSLEAHSETAPKKLRADESRELKQVKNTAAAQGSAAMAGIHATRVTTGQQVGTGKKGTKKTDEDKRKEVTDLLQKVFDQTKCDVEKILEDLDEKVDDQFTTKEKRARDRFTREHEEGMERYKDERYGGLTGKARWVRDLFAGLPEEANRIYERARDNYLTAMDQIITEIADTVEAELRRAKDRIAAGRKELKSAVDKLPADLRAIGREAATEFEGKFDELKDTVNEKGTELVDTLATKYTEAVKSVDDEIAAEKEKNKGLVAKAADAIGGAIKAILELGRMLMGVLRKAASAIGAILKDPIGFLGNLVTGVGGGLKLFMRNAGRHLQGGVLAWLLGTGGAMGLQLPRTFDILGILTLIAMILGLSWPNIRARLARRVPNQALAAAETAVPLVSQVKRRGVAGMWDDLKTRVGDLKKELISNLVKFLLPTIIIAGITWIVSLFNPASAFIRACKMIIDIIRFIVTNARQIIDFVNAVLDAVIAIARGGTGGVPALVERALARSIPVLIGALAALLGIGGIAGKVKQVFQKLARPVNRAIDWVINKIVGLVKKLWNKIKPKPRKPRKPKRPDRTKPRKRRPDRKKPADKRLEPARASLSMSGEGHTLIATPGRGVDLASSPKRVSTKAKEVISELKKRKPKDPKEAEKVAALNGITDSAKKVEGLVKKAEKQKGATARKLLEYPGLGAAFLDLKNRIVKYGSDFGVKDLTEGDLVDRVKLEKEIQADIVTVARDHDKEGQYEDVIEVVVAEVNKSSKISKYTAYAGPASPQKAATTKDYPKWHGKGVIEGATYFVVAHFQRDSGRTYYILVGDQNLISKEALKAFAAIQKAAVDGANLSVSDYQSRLGVGRIRAGRKHQYLRSIFLGSVIEKYVSERVDGVHGITWLGAHEPGQSVPDFTIQDGDRLISVDVTGPSPSAVSEHLKRAYYSRRTQIISYPAIADSVLDDIFK